MPSKDSRRGVQCAAVRSRNDKPTPSSSASTCPTPVKSDPKAAPAAIPSHQPVQAGCQRDGIDAVRAPSTQTAP